MLKHRPRVAAAGARYVSPSCDLLTWTHDPVARRYSPFGAAERMALPDQSTFTEAMLFRDRHGGAIILPTRNRRVLAMDYPSTGELDRQWRETQTHYAGIL